MKPKIVVFDVDETLGNFIQFSIFGHVLEEYFNKPGIMYRYFNDLVDLYPEIIRPNMVRILDYIRKKKNAGVCSKVMIYTNNAGPDKWVGHIRQYFENKLRTFAGGGGSSPAKNHGLAIVPPLFDHTIGGFKPNQESTSSSTYPQRTTSHKTVNEFIRCGRLPSDLEICFLDDVEHPKMVDEVIGVQNIQSSLVHAFCEGTKFGSILEEHGLGLDGFKKALQNTSLDSDFDFDFDTEEKSDE